MRTLRRHPDGTRVALALLLAVIAAAISGALVAGEAPNRFGPAVMLGLLVPLLALPRWRPLVAVGAALATWCLVVGYMTFLPDVIDPQPDVSQAVGQAAFYGTPYVGPQIAALFIALTLVGLGGLAAVLARRNLNRSGETALGDERESSASAKRAFPDRRKITILVAVTAAVAFTLVPDPRAYFEPQLFGPNWDGANLLTWESLISRGLLPMRDFFYPYGGQWIYDVVPEGPLLRWVAEAATLALAAWSLWVPSGRRPWRVGVCLVAIPVLEVLSPTALWRYLPGLLMATTYAALGPAQHKRLTRAHLGFGAACLLAIFLEPELLIYGLAGMALVLIGEILRGQLAWRPKKLLRCLAIDALPVLGAIGLVTLTWLVIGATEGNFRLYLGLRATSAAAAIDPAAGALYKLALEPSIYVVYLAVPALLLASGLAHAILARGTRRPVSPLLLAGAGFSFVFLLKHLSRFTSDQSLLIPLLVLVWTAILLWDSRRLVAAVATGAFAGAMAVTVQQRNGVTDYLKDAVNTPVHAVDAALLPARIDEVRKTSASRFTLRELAEWPERRIVRRYRRLIGGRVVPDFWGLGDAQLLYVLLNKDPPYQIEPYDSSPIAEQREVLQRLEKARPPFMIWNRNVLPYTDPVPYPVRAPLLYAYAVRNYVPRWQSPEFDILRERRPGEAIPGEYWHRTLGRSLKLGYIPSYSRALNAEACSGGPDCTSYVVAEGRAPVKGKSVRVAFRGGKRTYWLIFRQRDGVRSYPVPLDRLWFRSILGPKPDVRSATPGWSVHLTRLRDGDSLY